METARLLTALRRDPTLALYFVFALGLAAFDVVSLIVTAFDLVRLRHLQEVVLPYTGWVPSTCYLFSLYFAFSALWTGDARMRRAVLLFPAMQVAFGILSWVAQGGPRVSDNPYLRISEWRPLWTIALPLVWLALLAAVKPRAAEAASLPTARTNG